MLHKRRIEKYKEIKNNLIKQCQVDKSLLVVEFDYGQNLPLPKLNVALQFNKGLLWLYLFNIHLHNDGLSFMYCFTENQSKKGA